MGAFSVWHWINFFIFVAPLFFAFGKAPVGDNVYGPKPDPVNFGAALSIFFKKYIDFRGRASRSEYWYSFLAIAIMNVALSVSFQSGTLVGLFSLGILLPFLAVASRRLHDINRSGWTQLLMLFGPVGMIVLLVWYCKASQDGDHVELPGVTTPAGIKTSNFEMVEKLAELTESGAVAEKEYSDQRATLLRS
jgi:uncharacterized membrane protein YhaH (DUF805 family)